MTSGSTSRLWSRTLSGAFLRSLEHLLEQATGFQSLTAMDLGHQMQVCGDLVMRSWIVT